MSTDPPRTKSSLVVVVVRLRSAVLTVRGPTLLSNGVPTSFFLSPSVWSPFWPAVTVSAVVQPAGAVTFSPSSWTLNSATSRTVTLTGRRSDDVAITVTFVLSSTGYVVPPPNIVLSAVGAGVFSIAGGWKCRGSSSNDATVQRVAGSGPIGNHPVYLTSPECMVYSRAFDRYIVNTPQYRSLRQFSPATQSTSTVLGWGNYASSWSGADGVGSAARFRTMGEMVADESGNTIYMLDERTIRKIDVATWTVTTIAGTFDDSSSTFSTRSSLISQRLPTWPMEGMIDGKGCSPAGPYAADQAIISPNGRGIALDALRQRLWFTDATWHLLRYVDLNDGGVFRVTSVHGIPGVTGYRDSTPAAVLGLMNYPSGLAMAQVKHGVETMQVGGSAGLFGDLRDLLFMADELNNCIRVMNAVTFVLSTFAGSKGNAFNADGIGLAAGIWEPRTVAIDSSNTFLFVVSSRTAAPLRRISLATRQVETIQMSGYIPSVLRGLTPHPSNPSLLYLVDYSYHQVWQLDLTDGQNNVVTPFIGGGPGCGATDHVPGAFDGQALMVHFNQPKDVRLDPFNPDQLWVAELGSASLRTVDLRDQTVRTPVTFPRHVVLPSVVAMHPTRSGLMFVASTTAVVWYDAAAGTWGQLAGIQGSTGTTNSPSAQFMSIQGMAVSPNGQFLYVGDQCRLRSISVGGALAVDLSIVSSLSGVSSDCDNINGGPGVARFGAIVSVMAVSDSLVYLAETTAFRVCLISSFNLLTLQRTVIAGSVCARGPIVAVDAVGLAAIFTRIVSAAYSADTQYIYIATAEGHLRFLDTVTGRVGTGLQAQSGWTNDGIGSGVGLSGVVGMGPAATGHQVYVAENTGDRVRSVVLYAVPLVSFLSPSIGAANSPVILNLNGLNFGTTVFDLVAIQAIAGGSIYSCTLTSWSSAQFIQCRLGSNVPLGVELRFRVNVRGTWGGLSAAVFRTVPPPSISYVSPAVALSMPTVLHLFGSFGSSLQADISDVRYGPVTGLEYSCGDYRVQNSTYITCQPYTATAVGVVVRFSVNIGQQWSVAPSVGTFMIRSSAFSIDRVCPSNVPSIYPSSLALNGDFSALSVNEGQVPMALIVEFRSGTLIRLGTNARVVRSDLITVESPVELLAGSVWDMRVSVAGVVGTWLPSALTVVTASSPIVSVTPRIVAPGVDSIVTVTFGAGSFCSDFTPDQLITGVSWGGGGFEHTGLSLSVTSATTLTAVLAAADTRVLGSLHGLSLMVRGLRTPPSLRDYKQTNAATDPLLMTFSYGAGAIAVQSQLNVTVPQKLTGADFVRIGPATAPLFGPLRLTVSVYVKLSLPVGAPESLQSSLTLTWTTATWAPLPVPVTLLSVASTVRLALALDAGSPSAPYFVAPAASVSVPAMGILLPRTTFGPGPACSAAGNDSYAPMLDGPSPTLLQNPADAIYDQSTESYLILDQDGAVLRRWFPVTNTWSLVFGTEQAPENVPSQPRNGPLNQALFGRNMYERNKMALARDGSRAYIWDAAHWMIRIVNFVTSTCSTLTGVNMGPLTRNANFYNAWRYNWLIETTNVNQRWVDVKSLAVDSTNTYLYAVDAQWIRKVTIADGTVQLLSGTDSYAYWNDGGLPQSGTITTCMWTNIQSSQPMQSASGGISSIILSADDTTLIASEKYGSANKAALRLSCVPRSISKVACVAHC